MLPRIGWLIPGLFLLCVMVVMSCSSKPEASAREFHPETMDSISRFSRMDSVLQLLQPRFICHNAPASLDAGKTDIEFDTLNPVHKLTLQEKRVFLGPFASHFEEEDIYFYNLQLHRRTCCVLTFLENLYGYSRSLSAILYDADFRPIDYKCISIAHGDAGIFRFSETYFMNDTVFVCYGLNAVYEDGVDSLRQLDYSICTNDSSVETYSMDAVKGFVLRDSLRFHWTDTFYSD